jgi:hypothetical protein
VDIDDNKHPHYLIEICYLALLQVPPNSALRWRNQETMARCVHYLASHYGRNPEDVQDEYERAAARLSEPPTAPTTAPEQAGP